MTDSITRDQILSRADRRQDDSPLFGVLPPEVRSYIYTFVLTDYPDPTPGGLYQENTYYTRPSYSAPRRTDTELLRTCRAIYRECWFLPFTLTEQTIWLTSPERSPPKHTMKGGIFRLRNTLAEIHAQRPGERAVELAHLRVFAQMWLLEQDALAALLGRARLHPRTVTLTIRHADWWWWENDDPLRFEAAWLPAVARALSPSVRALRIELETVHRKRHQLQGIAEQMAQRWSFAKQDGTVLYAGTPPEESTWTGPSEWDGQRWRRDETEPHRIRYHVLTVVFRPEREIERLGGSVSHEARRNASEDECDSKKLQLLMPAEAPTWGEQGVEDASVSSEESEQESDTDSADDE